uniref:Translation initiation factor IF2/IF5 domain-containing protein n=1 Tax=viral metagenome TaxID=1070528 RepID=A0A6C0CMB7_9ZZZZ
MSKKIPIPKTKTDDPFYRYTRPVIESTTQTNFIKLVNIAQVAMALERTPQELVQYLKKALNTNVKLVDNIAVINHKKGDIPDIEDILEQYISRYVMCAECSIPETYYDVTRINKKKVSVAVICKACGASKKLPKYDFSDWIKRDQAK